MPKNVVYKLPFTLINFIQFFKRHSFCILTIQKEKSINKKQLPMKKIISVVLCSSIFLLNTKAQDSGSFNIHDSATINPPNQSPYKIHFIDAPVIAAGIGLSVYGVHLIDTKDPLSEEKLATMSKNDIPFFDRGNAGYYSPTADNNSYIPFYTSFAMPVAILLINKNERHNAGQILVMYLETMSITGALFTLSAGTIDRSRPLVYGTKASLDKRLDANSQRSFYAGHTAATAAASFFAAKVFADFNPDSKAKPYIWALAATLPAITGYFRYQAGMHFLSDNIIGYVIGAGTGILVPQLHKTKLMKNVTFVPAVGKKYKGVSFVYRF